jgi:hypothetical protein
MLDELEYEGNWWLPGGEPVRGKLSYAPSEGLRLELDHFLPGAVPDDAGDRTVPSRIDILLGKSFRGELLTLVSCSDMVTIIRFGGGTPSSSYRAERLLVGAHFQTLDAIRFESIAIQLTHLNRWAGWGVFGVSYQPDKIEMVYTKPQSIVVRLDEQTEASFESLPSVQSRLETVSMQHACAIKLQPTAGRPLDQYLSSIRHIRNFFTLESIRKLPCP